MSELVVRLLPAAWLAARDPAEFAARWRGLLASPELDVVVAELDGQVVGWASAGAGRELERPRERELEGIYLLASAYGSGAGQALLDRAVSDEPAYLWMAEDNPRAEAFYRRNGFHRDGSSKPVPMGPHTLDAVRLVR